MERGLSEDQPRGEQSGGPAVLGRTGRAAGTGWRSFPWQTGSGFGEKRVELRGE